MIRTSRIHQYINSHLCCSQTIAVPLFAELFGFVIHNPARSVALRRRLPFLQKRITVTCERFSAQQLTEPNHVSNCVGPAWLGVGGLKSVRDSHPYFIRAAAQLSEQLPVFLWSLQDQTMTLSNGTIPEAELPSEFIHNVYLFRGTKELTQLPSMKQKNFESTVKNFGDSMLEHTFSEYPVQFLSKWYDKMVWQNLWIWDSVETVQLFG
jgi:hypothetical protein